MQVRRKADPAKGGFQEFIRIWVDDGRVIGTASHTEIKGEASKLERVVVGALWVSHKFVSCQQVPGVSLL